MLVVVLCFVVIALARQIGTLHLRLGPRGALELDAEGPQLGEAPPPIPAEDLDGAAVVVGGPGEPQLLMFVSPGCQVCDQVLPSLSVVAAAGRYRALVVTDTDAHESANSFAAKRIPVPIVPGQQITSTYNVPGTPYIVTLDEFGVVRAKGTVNNLEQIEGLLDTAARRIQQARAERQAV